MGTRALRVVILVAAVVLGVLIIKNGFAGNPDRTLVPRTGHATRSPGPSPTPKATRTKRPPVRGVVVVVLNGTHQVGLAASMTTTLMSAGYRTEEAGQGPITNTTVVYYRADSMASAQYLLQRFFPTAQLKAAPASLLTDARLQIVVIIGADFNSPSPSISP